MPIEAFADSRALTLGVAIVFPLVINRYSDFTGGANGKLALLDFDAPFGLALTPVQWRFLVICAVAGLCFLFVRNVLNSRVGRAMAMVRSNEVGELQQSAQMRHALEVAGVHRATGPGRDHARVTLEENLAAQEAAFGAGAFADFVPLALRFHRGFVAMAENELMLAAYDRLQDRQLFSINQSAPRISGDPDLVLAEHRTLLEAALDGDRHGFSDALDVHQVRNHGFEDGRPT